MHYYSTNNRELEVPLKEAVIKGLAADRGLFMPASVPVLTRATLEGFRNKELPEIALSLSSALFGEDIPAPELEQITREAINFDTPLVQVEEGLYALELFHGPTLAFKDVGARFLARLLGYYTREMEEEIHVLVATSGDTGSAVANGFLGVKGVRVHVLYPSGGVTPLQEKQFTTLGNNITALEVDGSFDHCQHLVKEAFMDEELNGTNETDLGQLHQSGPVPSPGLLLFQGLGTAGARNQSLLFGSQWELRQYDSRTYCQGDGIAGSYLPVGQ